MDEVRTNNDTGNEFEYMDAQRARKVSRCVQGHSVEYAAILRDAVVALEAAAYDGKLGCEIKVDEGFEWKLMDDLIRLGYDARRIEGGTLAVNWV